MQLISNAGGGGTVLLYNKNTGGWLPLGSKTPVDDAASLPRGKPLVLVLDWYKESDISDSGFSEAAADASFASIVDLSLKTGDDLLKSPIHFIGHSRGTVVNSEIIQRLGTHAAELPDIPSLQILTLYPHDFNQRSLDVPLGDTIRATAETALLAATVGASSLQSRLRRSIFCLKLNKQQQN